jgi:acetylornithine deacetylase/succinyl-diaminopimelate desuccinylase-like protein
MVVGLGAQNPKGHGACALVAAEAVAAAGLELAGDLHVGFGGGGMPSDRRRPGLPDGHGAGCAHLVEAVRPDHAVIAKTGWAVSWAEVGLAWFEVEVTGTHTYVGSRHLLPYRSAIAEAGRLAAALDDWFDTWAAERADDLVRPQGVVGAIEGGWARMPAFTPATCRLLVDLRLPPGVTGDEAATELAATVGRLADELGVEARCRHLRTIPGTRTDPDAWVIRSSIAAWEDLEGRPHEPIRGLSGATDANTLRAAGVPTARVGLPKVHRPGLEVDFQLGMNAVDLADMERLCRHLVRVAVDTCARPREETQ